eukprot:COSAG02_NODE_3011_length_7553_cov_14.648913_1_plen_85_part_00
MNVEDMNFSQLMRVDQEQFDGALKLNQDGSKLKLSELATYRERVVAAQAKKLRLDQERAAMMAASTCLGLFHLRKLRRRTIPPG